MAIRRRAEVSSVREARLRATVARRWAWNLPASPAIHLPVGRSSPEEMAQVRCMRIASRLRDWRLLPPDEDQRPVEQRRYYEDQSERLLASHIKRDDGKRKYRQRQRELHGRRRLERRTRSDKQPPEDGDDEWRADRQR